MLHMHREETTTLKLDAVNMCSVEKKKKKESYLHICARSSTITIYYNTNATVIKLQPHDKEPSL